MGLAVHDRRLPSPPSWSASHAPALVHNLLRQPSGLSLGRWYHHWVRRYFRRRSLSHRGDQVRDSQSYHSSLASDPPSWYWLQLAGLSGLFPVSVSSRVHGQSRGYLVANICIRCLRFRSRESLRSVLMTRRANVTRRLSPICSSCQRVS